MTNHKVGTREEWLSARRELLEREKEHTRRGDELARQRRELPWVRIEKEYSFDTDEATKTLAELFDGRSQLLVYHFMFGPEYEAGCPSCSSIADGFNGFAVHLAHRADATMLCVSRAPLAKLQAYKRRMGWTFPWVSSFGSDFNFDFAASFTAEQLREDHGLKAAGHLRGFSDPAGTSCPGLGVAGPARADLESRWAAASEMSQTAHHRAAAV